MILYEVLFYNPNPPAPQHPRHPKYFSGTSSATEY